MKKKGVWTEAILNLYYILNACCLLGIVLSETMDII